jgi:hypothetical protein
MARRFREAIDAQKTVLACNERQVFGVEMLLIPIHLQAKNGRAEQFGCQIST